MSCFSFISWLNFEVSCINIFCDCYFVIQFNSMSESKRNNEKAKINKLKIYFRNLFHEIVAQNLIFEIKSREEKKNL